jgi:hypothetical protein
VLGKRRGAGGVDGARRSARGCAAKEEEGRKKERGGRKEEKEEGKEENEKGKEEKKKEIKRGKIREEK